MKRSEMIQIMKIASATGPSAENMDKYLGNILTKMEQAGMLPPSFVKKLTDEESESYGTNHDSYYTGNIRINEWEEE